MPRRKTLLYCVVALLSSELVVQAAIAAGVSFLAEVDDAGAAGTTRYGTDGYDLYATSLDGEATSSGSQPFGPTRITSLPSYITSITSAGANSYFRSNDYVSLVNPQTGTLVHSGLTYNFSPSNAEKGLLRIQIGPGAPPVFYVGYITDNGTGVFDYPDALRFRQTSGVGTGDSGLITTVQDINGGVDIYFFRISGALPGDAVTISGIETVGGPGYYNLTAMGLTFGQAVPEPASLALLAFGSVALVHRAASHRCRSRHRSPRLAL